jgi:hypothetical protein
MNMPGFGGDDDILLLDLPGASGSNDSQAGGIMPLDSSISHGAAATATTTAPPTTRGARATAAQTKGRKPTPAERNRAAQKRFRERQKERMTDMNGRVDELTSEVEQLRAELAAARSRTSVLSKVVDIRDDQLRLTTAQREIFDLPSTTSPDGQKALIHVPPCTAALPSSRALVASDQKLYCNTLQMTLSPAEVRAIKAVPPESFISRWKGLTSRIGDDLMTLEACPDPENPSYKAAADAIAAEINAMGEMCWLTAVFAPGNIHALMATTLDGGASGARADDFSHWQAVAAALKCTEEQKGELKELRMRYLAKMAAAKAEGAQILARLKGVGLQCDGLVGQALAAEMMDTTAAAAEFNANVQKVHAAACELIGTTLKSVLTKLQKARLIVDSFPFYPDIYQIATAMCGDDI